MKARGAVWAGPTIAVIIGLWLTSSAWGPRPPSGDDVMALVVRISDGLRVLGAGHLDGWSSSFLTGHPQFLHYGPGLAVAAGLLRVLSFGQLSVVGTLSVLFAVSFAAVAPTMWFLARSLGSTRVAATVAAVLALVVNSPYGVGLAGLYETGLVTHALVAPFACLAIGAAVRIVGEPRRARWPVLLASSLAVIIATHVISTLIAPVLAAACVAVAVANRRASRQHEWFAPMGLACLAGTGLAAFWLLPYLTHLGERGDVTVWPTPTLFARINDVASGQILFPAGWFAWLVAAGALWVLVIGRHRFPLLVGAVVAPLAFLVLAHGWYRWFPRSEIGLQLANRGLGYAGLLAVVPLAALIADVATRAVPRRAELAGLAIASVLVLSLAGPLRKVSNQQPAAHPSMARTAATLRRLVPDGARFATERDFPDEVERLGVRHPDFWLAQQSGRNTLNTFGVELSPSPEVRFLTEFLKTPTELVNPQARDFARVGVTHIVTLVPATTARLLATGRFEQVAEHRPLTVLEVKADPGQPLPASLVAVDHGTATAALTRWSDGGESVAVRVESSALTTASLAIGWSRAWRMTLDGQRVPVLRRPDGLVGVTLPGGAHDLELRFSRAPNDATGPAISALTFGAGLWWVLRRRRRASGG